VAGPFIDLGGPRSTDDLIRILQPIVRAGLPLGEALLALGGPFPVAGPAFWSNDWQARRCVPHPHLHRGIDIFAPYGTPVVAVAEGRVSKRISHPIAGLSVEITAADGVQYFYAHLSGFADGLGQGHPVQRGDILGFIGVTGNAVGSPPHLHLEIQPGGVSVPPKPYVDQWLETAEGRARKLLQHLRVDAETIQPARFPRVAERWWPSLSSTDAEPFEWIWVVLAVALAVLTRPRSARNDRGLGSQAVSEAGWTRLLVDPRAAPPPLA
jgi:hypothetical protein